MGPQVANFPASLGQDFQPSDRGEGAVAATMLALPIGLPGQPPVMVATLINKLLPLGAPQQQQLDAMLKGNADGVLFGSQSKHHPAPPNADKPPFSDADIVVSMAVAHFIAQKAMKCRLACSMTRLRGGMMARACAFGGAGVGGESVLSCTRSQELCAAILSDVRSAANWTCIDMMLVLPGPPIPLGKSYGLQSCVPTDTAEPQWGKSSLIVHVVRDEVSTSAPAAQASAQVGCSNRPLTKPVSEASLSQLQAQLATQLLPQNFRRPATLEIKGLLQTQSHLLNQIVSVTVSEGVVPTEVGTDYAVIQNVDHIGNAAANATSGHKMGKTLSIGPPVIEVGPLPIPALPPISSTRKVITMQNLGMHYIDDDEIHARNEAARSKQAFNCGGEVETLPLTDVEEVVRYACSDSARGLVQCFAQGQALLSSREDQGSNDWTLCYSDKRFNPSTRIFARMDPSSSIIAAVSKPFSTGTSNGQHCVFMPVFGAGGDVIAVLRVEKNVKAQAVGTKGSQNPHFSEDEIDALSCVGQHCGSILQVADGAFVFFIRCDHICCRLVACVFMKSPRRRFRFVSHKARIIRG
jgi:hypothetical protein